MSIISADAAAALWIASATKQDYIPYNPFEKLELKKMRDEGNVQPAEIKDIQTLLKALDKHNYVNFTDYQQTDEMSMDMY